MRILSATLLILFTGLCCCQKENPAPEKDTLVRTRKSEIEAFLNPHIPTIIELNGVDILVADNMKNILTDQRLDISQLYSILSSKGKIYLVSAIFRFDIPNCSGIMRRHLLGVTKDSPDFEIETEAAECSIDYSILYLRAHGEPSFQPVPRPQSFK